MVNVLAVDYWYESYLHPCHYEYITACESPQAKTIVMMEKEIVTADEEAEDARAEKETRSNGRWVVRNGRRYKLQKKKEVIVTNHAMGKMEATKREVFMDLSDHNHPHCQL